MAGFRKLLLAGTTMAAVVVLGGCGGSSSGGSSAGGSASGGGTTSASTATSANGSGGGGDSSSAFCAQVKSQEAYLQGTALSTLLGGGSPAAWKAYFAKAEALNQQLVDAAPSEIKSTMVTLRQTSVQLQAAFAAVNYDVSKLGSAKLLNLLKDPTRVQASQKVTAYVQSACGIDLTKVGG